jgi:hypothetical protein
MDRSKLYWLDKKQTKFHKQEVAMATNWFAKLENGT